MTHQTFAEAYMLETVLGVIGFGAIALKPAGFPKIFFRRWPQTPIRVNLVRYVALICCVGGIADIFVRCVF